jgi:hypothetical protein
MDKQQEILIVNDLSNKILEIVELSKHITTSDLQGAIDAFIRTNIFFLYNEVEMLEEEIKEMNERY